MAISLRSGLLPRAATGVALIAVALAAVWAGGAAFAALTALGALLMFGEWAVMFRLSRGLRLAGLAVVALAILFMRLLPASEAVIGLGGAAGLAMLFVRTFARRSAFWLAGGILYCGLPVISLLWLRGLPNGAAAVLWTLAIVWATDIAAYFTGRALGGPKLAPAISPNKTWAGAIGGVIAAALVGGGLTIAYLARPDSPANLSWLGKFALLGVGFAVLAILGDLFESWLKRRAGVKDSGNLLPGHGGVLDRLDGLVPVACASALVFGTTGWAG